MVSPSTTSIEPVNACRGGPELFITIIAVSKAVAPITAITLWPLISLFFFPERLFLK
jgi:hypothetical protein